MSPEDQVRAQRAACERVLSLRAEAWEAGDMSMAANSFIIAQAIDRLSVTLCVCTAALMETAVNDR